MKQKKAVFEKCCSCMQELKTPFYLHGHIQSHFAFRQYVSFSALQSKKSWFLG